jgi:hypothetical protein
VKALLAVVASLFFAPLVLAQGVALLRIQPDSNWDLELATDEAIKYLVLSKKRGEGDEVMIFDWPVDEKPESISETLKVMVDSFIEASRENPLLELKKKTPQISKMKGSAITGEVALFELKLDFCQAMFMFTDGRRIWNGQFTGEKKTWLEAQKVIEAMSLSSPKKK